MVACPSVVRGNFNQEIKLNQLSTAQNVCNDYTAMGSWIGLCTGPPGNSSTVLNECSGGSPAYTRQETSWTPGGNGGASGSTVTMNLPSGTYPYMIMCASSSGNTVVDWCILSTPISVTSQSAVTLTPSASVV